MAQRMDTSIFVKNGSCAAGLGAGGEGYTSFTIASPTGEGLTTARTFCRQRRCVLVGAFRIGKGRQMLPRPPGERSLGFIELRSLARGVVCADAMVKTAAVRLTLLTPVSSGRMLVAVDGGVAPVEAAIARGVEVAGEQLHDALFLADLHPEIPSALSPDAERPLSEAVGLVETATAAAAIRAADAGLKAANVRLIGLRLAYGISGKGLLQLTGKVAAVEAGVEAAVVAVEIPEFLLGREVIPSVHEDVQRWLGRRLREDDPPFDPVPGE